MKLQAFIATSLLCATFALSGCVTSKTTKGFPHDFAQEKKKNGVGNFFAKMTKGMNKPKPSLDPTSLGPDATSMEAKPTVSTDLLVVTGEMGLQQRRFDLAASYFERALKMDPNNARAKAGLAKAKAAGGGVQDPAEQIQQFLQQQQNLSQKKLGNSLGQKSKQAQNKIKLVSHEELDGEQEGLAPESISVEAMETPKEDNQAKPEIVEVETEKPQMTMLPAIPFRASGSGQRVANPFFGSDKSILPKFLKKLNLNNKDQQASESEESKSNAKKRIRPVSPGA